MEPGSPPVWEKILITPVKATIINLINLMMDFPEIEDIDHPLTDL